VRALRSALGLLLWVMVMVSPAAGQSDRLRARVATGADVLVQSRFAMLAGKRVGLVTNQTGLSGGRHLVDLMAEAGVRLTAILAPEHGFRGAVEAGAKVGDEVDARTGVPVYSLYGATRKPTRRMLRDVDVLLFDIQDIGVRFYTYISTMGLAMQAAAEARIPFIVLDRPNPLGGVHVAGFVIEPALVSFVGQYPIPIQHGLTAGELARMIKGERWLPGLDKLDLTVVEMQGWTRSMRWPDTGLAWVATSPNIPTFEAALVYPGIGIVGELAVNEGRGTPTPFSLFGAPWLDGERLAERLAAARLGGVSFSATSYTPRPIPGIASKPRFAGKRVGGVKLRVTGVARLAPLEMGMHALAGLMAEARRAGRTRMFPNLAMFHRIAGTRRLHRMLLEGRDGAAIIAAWEREVTEFKALRARYLAY
jgi:uncharacterized protein YbbC (DUF1343 family)